MFSVFILLRLPSVFGEYWPLSSPKQSLPAWSPSCRSQFVSSFWVLHPLPISEMMVRWVSSSACSVITPYPGGTQLWPCSSHLKSLGKHSSPPPMLTTWAGLLKDGAQAPAFFRNSTDDSYVQPTLRISLSVLFTPMPPLTPMVATSLSSGSLPRPEACFLDMSTQDL